MKKFSFLAFVCLFALFSTYTLSQTRRKTTTSTKRAANMQKSSKPATNKTSAKRAAVSSTSTKRAATSSTATRRAATNRRNAQSNIAKRAATRRAATQSSNAKNSKSSVCPIGVVVKKVEDNGNDVYYSAKDTVCSEPENVMGTTDLTGLKLPTWIAGKDAYVFRCNIGFVKSKKDNADICIDQNTICPLNTTIAKTDNKYINPFTSEECSLPASASTLKLTEDTNTNSTISTDEAYYSYCNKNYYKVSDVECKACPTGKYNNGAYIKYENITDSENKVVGKKASLIEGATSESQCYTMEELKVMQAN